MSRKKVLRVLSAALERPGAGRGVDQRRRSLCSLWNMAKTRGHAGRETRENTEAALTFSGET